MKDDDIKVLQDGEEVPDPKVINIEQGTMFGERVYPSFDPDQIRTMRVLGPQFGGLLSYLLEENLDALTGALREQETIASYEDVVDVLWEGDMPYSLVIRGGNGGELIPFKADANTKKLLKTAYDNKLDPEAIPKGEDLAIYVESLQLFLMNSKSLDKQLVALIKRLPAPSKVSSQDFSNNESIILFETVNYLWKKITSQDIIEETRTINNFQKLSGCYLMLTNGLMLHGINHYSIIKNNSPLLIGLLDLNGLTFHEYLSSTPERIIAYAIRNGAVRMFVNSDQEGFFQMTEEAYTKWARSKVRKFDLKRKIVKVMDLRMPYKGWESGITVQL